MKKITVLVLSLLMILSITSFAGDKQLSLDTSSIEDGAREVSLTPEFNLVFTNNVINSSVRDNNMSAISMIDADGNNVDIEVLMADDQINPEEKRNVSVKVKGQLKEGSEYKLLFSSSFMGKNGSNLAEDLTIGFTTEGGSSSSKVPFIAIGGAVLIMLALAAKKKSTKTNA